jgi:FimV-like protein
MTFAVVALLGALLGADDKTKPADKSKAADDSPIVKKTREVKLATKITVDFKDERLKDVLEEFKKQVEGLSVHLEAGVSGNQAFTYAAKDKPLRDVFDEMFKGRGLGYVIGRKAKDGDRYEGWLIINQSDERGDPLVKGQPVKTEAKPTTKPADPVKPKPADPAGDAEKLALSKLKSAKIFIEDGKNDDAKEYLEQIIKKWPETKAAEEAKTLLAKLKK